MSYHKKIFVNPSHTKKVFINMKRAGKDFSRRITPLFDTMMVQASEEVEEGLEVGKEEEVKNYRFEKTKESCSDEDEVFGTVTTVRKESKSTKTGEAINTAGVEDSAAPTIPTTVEETLAKTLMEIKAAKSKAKGIVFHDQEEQEHEPSFHHKPKAKGIVFHDQEEQPERPLKTKEQVALAEQMARDIQAQLDVEIIEEERHERQKQEEANIALIESWENTQAMMEDDRLLAKRLQTREREELADK
ncbi:hypothetical protein Tco_0937889 [Tanacetum coccineum]|uniref:Uncharacterized protein n=1 Tax=Tanacetum coccineum TaxID=301880 RepID=A0ABQ5DLS2_9ASTR